MHVIVKIPYRGLSRIGPEQKVIWMTVEIKIRHTRYVPAGPQRGAPRGADAHAIVKIPYRGLSRIGPEQKVIWMTVEIKIRHTCHVPARPQRGPVAPGHSEHCC